MIKREGRHVDALSWHNLKLTRCLRLNIKLIALSFNSLINISFKNKKIKKKTLL
jgi:hypothetical protein